MLDLPHRFDALRQRASPPREHAFPDPELLDRARGAYLGLALGDALGATVEFLTPSEIVRTYGGPHRQMIGGGWLKLAQGQVTDDTGMSLALGEAIIEADGWSLDAVGRHFIQWLRSRPVDVGNTCRRGIQRLIREGTLEGPTSDGDAGNGACMRNLPVAIATLYDGAEFEQRSIAQAHITHNHQLSDASILTLGHMVRRLLLGASTADCRAEADALVARHRQFRFSPYPGRASGYIVDTVQTVLHFFFACEDFEECIVGVINRGEDADTTGAIAGMLAGARCGAERLPKRWLRRLDAKVRARIDAQVPLLLAIAGGDATTN